MRFARLYLASGIAASLTHAIFNAASPMPVLGASGAIAGVIAAYAVRFPFAWVRVLVLIVFIPLFFSIPALLFAGIWFFMQVVPGYQRALHAVRRAVGLPGGRTSAASSPAGFCCACSIDRRTDVRAAALVQRRPVGAVRRRR